MMNDEKIENSMEFKIVEILDGSKMKREDRLKILYNIIAVEFLNQGLPFESFKNTTSNLVDDYEETWPIG